MTCLFYIYMYICKTYIYVIRNVLLQMVYKDILSIYSIFLVCEKDKTFMHTFEELTI